MAGLADYDYDFFDDYQADVLSRKPSIEQLILLDDEVANKVTMLRYEGPVDPIEWRFLEQYYSGLFADFITDRIRGLVDTEPIEKNRTRFHDFRENIASLNKGLPAQRAARSSVISKPAETVLLKQLRQLGFDSSALDVSHIGRGGGLYLLELFVTAAQQEALSDTELLTVLLDEADGLSEMHKDEAMARLHRPVLMVSLWDNQEAGLYNWLDNGRHGILEMATATGKTVAGIAAIAECCGILPDDPNHTPRTDDANIMVVAHSNAILKQWEQEIQEKLGLPMPAGNAGEKAESLSFRGGEVEFYTAQSLLPRYDRDLAGQYDLVIYDEVHHYSNLDGYGAAIDRPNYRGAMGLSATIGDDGELKRRQLTELLGDVVYTYGVEDARRDGIIPEFDWTVHPTPLDPYEREEWEEATESISDQFKHIRRSSETKRLLKRLPVPFTELEDLGDFIRAHEAASRVFNDDEIPDEWSSLQATIHSRTWIRHRSQPKIEGAIELAKGYLEDPDQPIKLVIFAMDIDTADEIAKQLNTVTDNVFRAHSKLESSSRKNNERVQKNINSFANCDNGVLVSPKMLDEGIDVPDAEVGINVAGTKTKLQLVQRMGRVLRKHGDQRPHFHHFIAVPDENYIAGLDSKEYVQELNWVRELGETIGVQPDIEEAGVDSDLLERAEQRGHELWAQDLLDDLEVETVQGNVHLDQLLEELTVDAIEILLDKLWLEGERVSQDDWKAAMDKLRASDALPVEGLQRVWWLFPLYRERPKDLDELLTAAFSALSEEESKAQDPREGTSSDKEGEPDEIETTTETRSGTTEEPEVERPTTPDESESSTGDDTPSENETEGNDVEDYEYDEPSVLEASGIEEVPEAISRRLLSKPETGVSIDNDLLARTGDGGFFSTGYLHQRPLQTYLLEGEAPAFLLSSKRKSPEENNQAVAELDSYRAITAITPNRVLCVIGNEPENIVIQVRHEDITKVDVRQTGQLFWKNSALSIETEYRTVEIPDGSETDLLEVVRYIRTAAYEERCAAGERIIESLEVLPMSQVGSAASILEEARNHFGSAVEWGNAHNLENSRAIAGIEFTKTCLENLKQKNTLSWEETRLEEAQKLVDSARTNRINRNESKAETEFLEAKKTLEAVVATADEQTSQSVKKAKQLLEKVESALAPDLDVDSSQNHSENSTEDVKETPSENLEEGHSRSELISELKSLAEELGGAPKAPEMDDKGQYSTHVYYQQFGSWKAALDAAGLDRRESLINELERIARELGEVPTYSQIDEHGRYSSGMYADEFGTITAARGAADFTEIKEDNQESQPRSSSEPNVSTDKAGESDNELGVTKSELTEEIRRLDTGERLFPYASDMDSDGKYKTYDCLQEFGSWDDALEAAGIDKRVRLLDELRHLRDELGRMPKMTDMDHRGAVSSSMYANFFGSWTEVKALIKDEQQATETNRGANSTDGSRDEDDSSNVSTIDDSESLVWEDIPRNSRLPGPIAVQIKQEKKYRTDRVEGRYLVSDINGKEFELKVWRKHEIDVNWNVDEWYLLENTRGTVWESDGEINRLLDSTRDLLCLSWSKLCGYR